MPSSIRWFLLLLTILVITNIILIIKIVARPKQNPYLSQFKPEISQAIESSYSDFYNSPCPDMELFDSTDKRIRLSDLAGEVIVLRFSRLTPQDLPYLIYLEHLNNRFKSNGLHIFFIHLLSRRYMPTFDPGYVFPFQIIEDDGYIASIFQAKLNDLIIVGRDFKLKFKHNQVSNSTIYNQIVRYLFEDSALPPSSAKEDVGVLLKNVYYKNVRSGQIENLERASEGFPALITLSISPCLNCPASKRLSLMRELSSSNKEAKFYLLFGRGNNFETIEKFAMKNNLMNDTIVGLIEDVGNLPDDDYYRIFKYNIDPCTYITNKKGKIIFAENQKNSNRIDSQFLTTRLN
jgi:hypothetical protein